MFFGKNQLLDVPSMSGLSILKIKRHIITIFRAFNNIALYPVNNLLLQGQSKQLRIAKRTSQNISYDGSMTVEAALVFPLFLFVMYAVMMLSQLMITNDEVDKALTETARYLAKEAYFYSQENVYEEQGSISIKAQSYNRFRQYIDESRLRLVPGGKNGISLQHSQLPNELQEIVLIAEFNCNITIPFFGRFSYPMEESVVQKIFCGYDTSVGWNKGEYVYVAEHGAVYHNSPDCSYIAIRVVKAEDTKELQGKRNCRYCCNKVAKGEYVTICGDCIHQNRNCSALKRTIHLVRRDQLGGLPLCSRCKIQ